MSLSRLAQVVHELVAKIGPVSPINQTTTTSSGSRIKQSLPWKTVDLRVNELGCSSDGDRERERKGRRKSVPHVYQVHQPPSESGEEDAAMIVHKDTACIASRHDMGSMDSHSEFEFDEESVEDEFLLVSQYIRELQYHDLRFLKNHVSSVVHR